MTVNDATGSFDIDYDDAKQVLIVDGVAVATALIRQLVVAPTNRWLRFTRSGNTVLIDQQIDTSTAG